MKLMLINKVLLKMAMERRRKDMERANAKRQKIVYDIEEDPTLSNIEVTEKDSNKRRTHGYVFGYGGGVRPSNLRGPSSTKPELLEKLCQSKKVKNFLRKLRNLLIWQLSKSTRGWRS